MFLSLSKNDRQLFSSVLNQLKRTLPILAKYKEPAHVNEKDLLAVLKVYARDSIERKAYKMPRDFQPRQQRVNFN